MSAPPILVPRIVRIAPGDPALAQLPCERGRTSDDYEFQVVTIPRGMSLGTARAEVTAETDRGRWDLVRSRRYTGGARKVWMRRRIIRVRSTLHDAGLEN